MGGGGREGGGGGLERTNEDENMPPLMRVSNDVQKSRKKSFRELCYVEEECKATDGVHDDDLGQHQTHDARVRTVVHQHPVDRRYNLEIRHD